MATFVPQFTNPNPIDPSVVGKLAPPQQTSLGDMLNLARGAQAYQQAQQVNPLQVQAAELELKKAQGTLQPTIRKAEAEATGAELGLSKDQLNLAGGMLTGFEYSDAFKKGDIEEMTKEAKTLENILKANKIPVEKTFGQMNEMLSNGDVNGVKNFVANLRNGLASSSEKFAAGLPRIAEVGGQPTTFAPGGTQQGAIVPAQIGAPPPVSNVQTNTGIGTNPVQPVKQISGTELPAPVIPEAQEITTPIPPRFASKPGNIVTDPSEIAYRDQGIKYVQSLANQSIDLSTQKRNVQEATKSITKLIGPEWQTYGIGGKFKKEISEKIGGSPDYAKVSKDLANLELSNYKNSGGNINSVEGLKLQQRANGTEVYPPEVLVGIVRRINSEYTNTELQAKAAQKYAQKYGESNLPTSFMQMWANNADSKVFELMNTVKEVKDPKKREEVLTDLFGNDPKELGIAWQKYKNIQKLVKDGSL